MVPKGDQNTADKEGKGGSKMESFYKKKTTSKPNLLQERVHANKPTSIPKLNTPLPGASGPGAIF